jgi:hypothetical protein
MRSRRAPEVSPRRAARLLQSPAIGAAHLGKKWYSYFVVTDEPSGAAEPRAAVEPSAPRRAVEVAGGAAAETSPGAPIAGAADLDAIYAAAQIGTPAHGYTILKVARMLESEHIRSLAGDVKRKSILVALDAAGVKVAEIVEDAVRRDRALDTYERVLEQHLQAREGEVAAENQRLEEEIARHAAELRARIDANARALEAERREFLGWQQQKQQAEAAIADAVGYFVTENPITATSRPAKGEVDAR